MDKDKAYNRFAKMGLFSGEHTIRNIFNIGYSYGYEDGVATNKSAAAQADLSGVKKILDEFAEKLERMGIKEMCVKPCEYEFIQMTDRQISNIMHGRDKDDNGEF